MQVTEAARGSRDIDEAAQIWAEATAARDGSGEVAGLRDSRPVIESVLDSSPAAFVLIARAADGTAAGFAAARPAAAGRAPGAASQPGGRLSELAYFGVSPSSWGTGVGELLLRELTARLRAAGYRRVQLLVYADNVRAIALYRRLGWQPAGEPAPHPRTGKPEQRYELALQKRHGPSAPRPFRQR